MRSIARIAGLLSPLEGFYADEGREVPGIETLAGRAMPQPYRSLLVHDRDMTSTLERHFGHGLHLRVLQVREEGEVLRREVVLLTDEGDRPVEFGAIEIQLDRFSPKPRAQIREGRLPLGLILRLHGIEHRSRPAAYFAIESEPVVTRALDLDAPSRLYGRHNTLHGGDGLALAEVVEILPPLP